MELTEPDTFDTHQDEAPLQREQAEHHAVFSRRSEGDDWHGDSGEPVGQTTEPVIETHEAHEQDPGLGTQLNNMDWDHSPETQAHEDGGEPAFDDEADSTAWQASSDVFGATISTLSEPQSLEHAAAENEAAAELANPGGAETDWPEPSSENGQGTEWGGFDERNGGDLFSRFGQAADKEQPSDGFVHDDDDDEPTEEGRSSWASRLMRPWREKFGSSRKEDDTDQAETEDAIRQALKAALAQPGDRTETAMHPDAPFAGHYYEDVNETREPTAGLSAREDSLAGRIGRNDGDASELDSDASSSFSFPELGAQTEFDEAGEQEQEPQFPLTGEDAKPQAFGAADDSDDAADVVHEESGDLGAFHGETMDAPDDDGTYRDQHRDAMVGGEGGYDETPDDFSDLYDEQFQNDGWRRNPADDVESDLAALQSELETTDLTAYEHQRSYGGLAVFAAWCVFLSVISGLVLALVSFRQEIMVALPGTAEFYRVVGFETADGGVDFADVRYRWTNANGLPMIEVTGQVVNRTDRAVRVPRVLVNVRDAAGSDPVSTTASVPREELAPRESASFTLEFLSPPENVAQIELEFDRSR